MMDQETWAPPKPRLMNYGLDHRAPESLFRDELMSLVPRPERYFSANIVRISPDLVVKYGTRVQMGEALNMMLAATIPSLHVPRVHDAWTVVQDVDHDPDHGITKCTYILMDWIHGKCLGEIWNSFDEARRDVIVHGVYHMVEALHTKVLSIPGPVGGGKSRGFWFTDEGAGPFSSQLDMELWFTSRLKVCQDYRSAPLDGFSFVNQLSPLVMCHLDVHTHNIIVDNHDRLWLLDWEMAGAYPQYFEQLFMSNDHDHPDFTKALHNLLNTPDTKHKIARIESIGFAVTTGRRLQPSQDNNAT